MARPKGIPCSEEHKRIISEKLKGRKKLAVTHCKRGHELTSENTCVNIDKYGFHHRRCKMCAAASTRASYDRNREKVRDRVRARRAISPDCTPEQRRKKNLNHIGWTPELFESTLIEQKGLCAICDKVLNLEKKQNDARACADHEHSTPPKPRGILCTNCNLGIGNLQDDPDIMLKALAYIRRFKCPMS